MRQLLHDRNEDVGDLAMLGHVEQLAEALRPGDRAQRRQRDEPFGVEPIDELGQHIGDVLEPAAAIGITHELERGRLGEATRSAPPAVSLSNSGVRSRSLRMTNWTRDWPQSMGCRLSLAMT
jgi:hypothetical protein